MRIVLRSTISTFILAHLSVVFSSSSNKVVNWSAENVGRVIGFFGKHFTPTSIADEDLICVANLSLWIISKTCRIRFSSTPPALSTFCMQISLTSPSGTSKETVRMCLHKGIVCTAQNGLCLTQGINFTVTSCLAHIKVLEQPVALCMQGGNVGHGG